MGQVMPRQEDNDFAKDADSWDFRPQLASDDYQRGLFLKPCPSVGVDLID